LITVLAQLQGIRVIARTSVFSYKGTSKTVRQIGSDLGVASLLEGSVRKAGNRIRVTAQLIDVATQDHTWAETFDRDLSDVFAVQAEVAKEVAKALKVRLKSGEEERLAQPRSVEADSYVAYLRGRTSMMASFSDRTIREAQWQFERAVSLDPTNARAWAALSETTHLLGLWYRKSSRKELDQSARDHALKAIQLDPNLGEGHSALGLLLYDSLEWAAAEGEALRALSLNPSYSNVRFWYSMLLQEEGRAEEALVQLRLAQASDPQSVNLTGLLATLLTEMDRLDEAERMVQWLRALDTDGQIYHATRTWYFYALHDVAAAFREMDLADSARIKAGLAAPVYNRPMMMALTGDKAGALALVATMPPDRENPDDLHDRGLVYGFAGMMDDCFRLLNEQFDTGGITLQTLRVDPDCAVIRQDPRFPELLKRAKLLPEPARPKVRASPPVGFHSGDSGAT
jgi:tetratricopeptide (TPR) repeat protein